MVQKRIDLFFELLVSPMGLALLAGLLISFIFLFRNQKAFWYFFALMALVSSFSEFNNEFIDNPPSLAGPLQPIRLYGRALAILILAVLLLYTIVKIRNRSPLKDRFGILASIIIIQLLILVKNIIYGNALLGLLAFLVFSTLIIVFKYGVSSLITDRKTITTSAMAITFAIFLFHAFSLYQSRIDFSPMVFPSGQFMGMTGNAQHAAVLLASSIPLFIFLIGESKKIWKALFFALGLLLTLYYLILTASRTGTLMAGLTFSVLLLFIGGKSMIKWLLGAGVILVIMTIIDFNPIRELSKTALTHYASTENSREEVFETQWKNFSKNPIFGADPRGKRIGFAESSYLGVAASLGIIGLIPLFFLMFGCARMIASLWFVGRRDKSKRSYCLMVIGGLIPLLAGALVEAYLLGMITWPLSLFLIYVVWGNYIITRPRTNLMLR